MSQRRAFQHAVRFHSRTTGDSSITVRRITLTVSKLDAFRKTEFGLHVHSLSWVSMN